MSSFYLDHTSNAPWWMEIHPHYTDEKVVQFEVYVGVENQTDSMDPWSRLMVTVFTKLHGCGVLGNHLHWLSTCYIGFLVEKMLPFVQCLKDEHSVDNPVFKDNCQVHRAKNLQAVQQPFGSSLAHKLASKAASLNPIQDSVGLLGTKGEMPAEMYLMNFGISWWTHG